MSATRANNHGILLLKLADKSDLHKAYMPFLKFGGLFVPTDKQFRLGDEVFLVLILPQETDRRPVAGKVVWINTSHSEEHPLGVGIHFMDSAVCEEIRARIEVLLAGNPSAGNPSHTM